MRHSGVVENPLRRRGLARVDVRGDADVADLVERRARHGKPPYHDGRHETPAPRARMLTRLLAAGYVSNQMLQRGVICKDYRSVYRSSLACMAGDTVIAAGSEPVRAGHARGTWRRLRYPLSL